MRWRIIGLSVMASVPLGCGTSTEPSADPDTPSTITADTTTTTTSAPSEWSGPPKLVTVHLDDLVAVDLVDRSRMSVLADSGALAASLGVIAGHIDGVDLSPDGTTVAFTFNGQDEDRSVSALYEVPADGSGEPRRIEVPVADFFLRPEYSPDGGLLAIYAGTDLAVIPTRGGAPSSPGIPMAYPPVQLTWSPDGARLIWIPHYERTSCCTLASVQVNASTGEILSEVTEDAADGRPYFDAGGALRTQQDWTHWDLDLDTSKRYALSVADGADGYVLEWWDTTEPDAEPSPLELDVTLSEIAPVTW